MSTKLTRSASPEPISVLLARAAGSVLHHLAAGVRGQGFDGVSEAHLMLFGHLDCGATHAARIAQRMQVSRQAISKTLRELQDLGFVRLADDPDRRNQKLVVMTARGNELAVAARAELARIEAAMGAMIGAGAMAELRRALEAGWGGDAADPLNWRQG